MQQKNFGHFNFSPFPKMETGRLTLRELVLEDEEALFKLRSDDRVLEFLEITKAQSKVDSRKFIESIIRLVGNNESVMWAITQKDQDELIGTICFWNISADGQEADIGYMLSPESQGQGIMRESVLSVIDYGFTTMKLKVIAAEVHSQNIRSIKLLEKEGFIHKKTEDGIAYYYLSNKAND